MISLDILSSFNSWSRAVLPLCWAMSSDRWPERMRSGGYCGYCDTVIAVCAVSWYEEASVRPVRITGSGHVLCPCPVAYYVWRLRPVCCCAVRSTSPPPLTPLNPVRYFPQRLIQLVVRSTASSLHFFNSLHIIHLECTQQHYLACMQGCIVCMRTSTIINFLVIICNNVSCVVLRW